MSEKFEFEADAERFDGSDKDAEVEGHFQSFGTEKPQFPQEFVEGRARSGDEKPEFFSSEDA